MRDDAVEASSDTPPGTPPQVVVPALPPDKLKDAVEAAQTGAVVGESLDWLSGYAAGAGLPSPEACGLAMDYDTMASIAFVLAAWAGALLEAAGQAQPAAGSAEGSAAGGATLTAPPGLDLPPGGLLLPPGVRRPEQP